MQLAPLAGAAEHGGEVILSLMDIQRLAREVRQRRTRNGLHNEAREWLNRLASCDDRDPVNLTVGWPQWSAWLASQSKAEQRFAVGVTALTAEFIEGTRDPNRAGRPRMDFCAYLTDGSFWRFHPGKHGKSSAEPRFFPAELPSTGLRGAAEHAWLQWLARERL